jgi:hypothetical protein
MATNHSGQRKALSPIYYLVSINTISTNLGDAHTATA